ncbi:GntR family transcriptional regulator [Nocardia sp. XZ_19_369]|uniref:GntR family transcriptional regulator n=1 Tax=Nocardia sp. XZ_19_369 TaxID=2769487 RepID=UPI00188F0C37|nr:GntR family transcriptional regulator [Nocardia sp. XZ_19_369]
MSTQPGRPSYRYLQIAEDLRTRIADGRFGPGSQIPTKASLMKDWNVALGTVDRALDELREQGLIETLQGRGSFVCAVPEREPVDDETAQLRQRIAVLEGRLEAVEAQMMDVYANLGLAYPIPVSGNRIEEAR